MIVAKMTAKQQRFCDEYLVDLNATQAAIRAGYSKRTAYSTAAENMTKPVIKEYLAARMAEKEAALIAKQDEVLKYLTAVMRGETESSTVVIEATLDGTTAAREMLKHPAESERLKAAELLGKRYGLYTDKVDVSGDVGVVIVDDIEDAESS
nr:MAG TPA: Terminase small subunit [Caudoviricetes sp.]